MSPVSPIVYTVRKSSPQEAGGKPPAPQQPENSFQAPTHCRWCGKLLVNPRRNQVCCCADCRQAWERSKRQRSKQIAADKPKGTCLWCDGDFDRKHKHQDFCSTDHQQAFNNFWKGKGPTLAKALHAWRVGKAKGGLTKLCREFSNAREELKDKRIKAGAGKKSVK